MGRDQFEALRAFFAAIEPQLPQVVAAMYSGLLGAIPEAKALFKGDLETQQVRYQSMLQAIIKLTRSTQLWPVSAYSGKATLPALNELKSRHANAGVTPAHFGIMKTVLLQACKDSAPAEFTPEAAEALAFIFDVLARSQTVQDSAAEALVLESQPPAGKTPAQLHDPNSYIDPGLPD